MTSLRLPDLTAGRSPRQLAVPALAAVAALAASFAVVGDTDARSVAGDIGVRIAGALVVVVALVATRRAYAESPYRPARRTTMAVLGGVASLAVWLAFLADPAVRGTFVSVISAVVVSAAVFILANRWLDTSVRDWGRFSIVTGAVVGALVVTVLVGNRAVGLPFGPQELGFVLVPVGAVAVGALGLALSRGDAARRRVVGPVGGAVVGAALGALTRAGAQPAIDPVALLGGPAVGLAVGAALGRLRGRPVGPAAVTGAALGWLVGSYGIPELDGGVVGAVLALGGLGALIGLRVGLAADATLERRLRMEGRVRSVIFLAPALGFLMITLIIPTVRTVYLSFLRFVDRETSVFVGLDNYRAAFGDPNFFDVSRWAAAFVSGEFAVFAGAVLAGVLLMLRSRRSIDGVWPSRLLLLVGTSAAMLATVLLDRAGRGAEDTAASTLTLVTVALLVVSIGLMVAYVRKHPGNSGVAGGGATGLVVAVVFLSLALFTNLRGTLFNNIWWVFMVTATATGLGLAIAAVADRSKGESLAKSIIFMPMAVSFVGAGIIWRFMYIARPSPDPQTGILNFLWVGLGRLSVGESATIVATVLFALAALLVLLAVRAVLAGARGTGWSAGGVAALLGLLGLRLLGDAPIGGVEASDGGFVDVPILFLSGTQQVGAYNNLFVMVPFIWIYTGFAMVIFSAAIKGVPADLIEAGRVDGATESQMFWRVVVPQIAPTIGVVITTVIVVVMKVFDIVKVMTNGNFGTQVLANEMWQRAFTEANRGLGSTIAVMLFLSVLPVMYVNIRRMQKEAAR